MQNQSTPENQEQMKNGQDKGPSFEEQAEQILAQEESEQGDENKQSKTINENGPNKEKEKEEQNFKDRYFYLAAEMENYRRRVERERESLVKYGNEKILSDLIEVVDNFERTIDALKGDEDKKIKNIVTGIDMVRKQFYSTLTKFGLTQVESVGKVFDPNFHEAVAQKGDDEKEEGVVLEEYQKGYTLNGRLLRASKVVVVSK
jgi:molecular chaperone GrpE